MPTTPSSTLTYHSTMTALTIRPATPADSALILHLVRADSDEPFASLLLELPDPDSAIDRVTELLDRYGMEPPTRPEHEPGECDLGMGDEDE